MRGLAGRSSEINKPKGERRWGWGEEVEARVGGRRRLKGTSGPTARGLRAGFLRAFAFCTALSGWRTGSGRGGVGQWGMREAFPFS